MNRNSPLTAAALAGALALTGAAHAAIIDVTYNGTVSGGEDDAGLFGGGDLTGDSFTAVYVVDTATAGGDGVTLLGGANFGRPAFASVTLTINGQTVSLGPSSDRLDQVITLANADIVEAFDDDLSRGNSTSLFNGVWSRARPASLRTPSDTINDPAVGYGGGDYSTTVNGKFESLSLSDESVSVTDVSAAPEPSAWALMIAGVGMIGAVLRAGRRRLGLAV